MADDPDLHDLVSQFSAHAIYAALKEAYRRGEAAERARVLLAIGGGAAEPAKAPALVPGVERAAHPETPPLVSVYPDDEGEGDGGKRAPRGLTREIVTLILREIPGLAVEEVQRRAVSRDDRLSAKTVYNELNREKGKLYRLSLGRWYLSEHSSPPLAADASFVGRSLAAE